MKPNQKSFLIGALVSLAAVALLVAGFWAGERNPSVQGSLTPDQTRISSNVYTTHNASTTAQKALSLRTNRAGLEIVNTGGNIARVWLYSTSTGVTSTGGMYLAANGGSYTPEFAWPGEVWVITPTGTTTVEFQESIR